MQKGANLGRTVPCLLPDGPVTAEPGMPNISMLSAPGVSHVSYPGYKSTQIMGDLI